MKKSTIIVKLLLLALFLMPKVNFAQNQSITVKGTHIQVSSNLQTVLEQVETIYAQPSGFTMSSFYNNTPKIIPVFLGFIMQRQEMMMKEKRILKHIDNEFALIDEIDTFLSKLAKAHNYINPANGSKMPPIELQNTFGEAHQGELNASFKDNFGIDPTTADITYILDRAPNPNNAIGNTDEHAKIDVAEKKNEINLFGEVSPYAMSGPEVKQWQDKSGSTKVEGLVCPEKNESPNTYYFDIDTNNIPNDGTDVRCIYFGKEGPLKEQRSYGNNKQHGVYINYKMKGDVRYLSYKNIYVNGKKHGVQESYHIDDKGRHYLSYQDTYVNDKREGVSKHWWNNFGSPVISLRSVANYSNNKLNGMKETYSISSSTGQPYLNYRTSYVNGKKNGEEIEYSESGKVEFERNYKNGDLHGEQNNYNPPTIYSRYINNEPQAIQCKSIYDNGVEISEKCWDSKGKIVKY